MRATASIRAVQVNERVARRRVVLDDQVVVRVERIARKVNRLYGLEDDGADTTLEGLLGYCEAASRHDESRGTDVWTYAFGRVRGRMMEHVRRVARAGALMPVWLRYDESEWEAADGGPTSYVSPSLAACDALGDRESNHSMESCMADRQVTVLVARILARLPEAHRHVVTEVLLHQRRMVDVADELGKPYWIIRSMLHRASREMRSALTREGYSYRELVG